jgi:hypothetical protein
VAKARGPEAATLRVAADPSVGAFGEAAGLGRRIDIH